jgi:hypothetical protein
MIRFVVRVHTGCVLFTWSAQQQLRTFLSPPSSVRRYNYDEEPLEERVGKYAREHLIIRDEDGFGEGGMGLGPGPAGGYHDPFE